MGSPEFKSDSEPIEPAADTSLEQSHVSSVGVTRREALLATLRAAVLGVVGATGIANAKDPDTGIVNKTGADNISAVKDRENHDRIMKLLVDGFAKEYSNLSSKEITDLANLCTESTHQNRFDALNIISTRKTEMEILQAEFAKDVYIECSKVRARCGSIQCGDLADKTKNVIEMNNPVKKAAYIAFIIEQATRVGDKNIASLASKILSAIKYKGVGLSSSDILKIRLAAITYAIDPATKEGKPITMSVDTRLDVVRETLDNFIPQAIEARDLSTAERARAIMYSKFTSGINRIKVPKVIELRNDISDASRKLYALRTVERAYNKERNSETGKLETANAQSAAARWLMETGDWNAGCSHLKKTKELSANSVSIALANAADLDLKTTISNATASALIKAANAWIYAGKSNPSSNKLYLKRVAEFAGRLKDMKGLNIEEDVAKGKIMQHLKRNGIGVGEVKAEPKEAFPKGKWVPLLGEGVMQNVKKTGPEWNVERNRIVVKDPVKCSSLSFDIPSEVLENGYEIEFTMERKDGSSGLYAPIGNTGHTTLVHLGVKALGLDRVEHKRFYENETTVRGNLGAGPKVKVSVKPVKNNWNVIITVNGKPVINCNKPATEFDLNPDWKISQPIEKEAPKRIGFIGNGKGISSYLLPRLKNL